MVDSVNEGTWEALVLGNRKTGRSPHLPVRILKVYVEVLAGFSHMYHPDGLNNTWLPLGYIFGRAPTAGMVDRTVHSKNRGGGEQPPIAHVQLKGQLAVIPC